MPISSMKVPRAIAEKFHFLTPAISGFSGV